MSRHEETTAPSPASLPPSSSRAAAVDVSRCGARQTQRGRRDVRVMVSDSSCVSEFNLRLFCSATFGISERGLQCFCSEAFELTSPSLTRKRVRAHRSTSLKLHLFRIKDNSNHSFIHTPRNMPLKRFPFSLKLFQLQQYR